MINMLYQNSLLHFRVLSDGGHSINRLSLENLIALIRYSSPTTWLVAVLDPFHGWEVVIILLHCNHPRHRVECDRLETEICIILVADRCIRHDRLVDLHVLSGILRVAAMNESKSGVGWPLTCVMKFVGATPYWYAGEPRIRLDT